MCISTYVYTSPGQRLGPAGGQELQLPDTSDPHQFFAGAPELRAEAGARDGGDGQPRRRARCGRRLPPVRAG